jgi:hypothetical protein
MEKSKIINCKLMNRKKDDETNEVVLYFEEDYGCISFNEDDQTKIKELFNNILKELIDCSIEIKLLSSDEEIKPSFLKDVAEEYINQLNTELSNVKEHLESRFDTNEE